MFPDHHLSRVTWMAMILNTIVDNDTGIVVVGGICPVRTCLVNWWFNKESKTCLCTSDKGGCFSNKNNDSYKFGLALSYVKLFLSSWKKYVCNLKAWYINK